MRRVSALLLACLGASAHAQPDAAVLWPAAGASALVAGGFDGWTAAPGATARLETPFYGGQARAALRLAAFESADAAVRPDFALVTATVGWTRSVRLGRALVGGGAVVGATQFRFGDADGRFSGNLSNETEAVVGALARVDVPLAGRLGVWAEAEALRVALAQPRALALVTAGASLRLDAPRWVQAVLR